MASTINIFCCYARKDERFMNVLRAHLSPMRHEGLIDVWHDRNIDAGDEWEKEIERFLHEAQIILLLISPDFMNSNYCYSIEMKKAMERHERGEAKIFPIILRPVDWEETTLSKLQVLPKDGKAVTTWTNPDKAWIDIIKQLRKTIQGMIGNSALESSEDNTLSYRDSKLFAFLPSSPFLSGRSTWKQVPIEDTGKGGIIFARIAIDAKNKYWHEQNMAPYVQGWECSQSFGNEHGMMVDPSFDITLLNTSTRPIILTDVGVEFVSVSADRQYGGGYTRAAKIEIDDTYIISVPDLKKQYTEWLSEQHTKWLSSSDDLGFFEAAPMDVHESISAGISDPIYFQAKATYRYRFILSDYCKHVPIDALLRMWIRTNQGQGQSHNIYILKVP